ncbi:YhjD/YihY/BrkB family envelope integrity protein [Mycoplasma sp. P36-A1]|uniref:YhjD/YihY/BrkB family envelope integrity protein n=1 Tax=Mycoplasma sp. P36-A1 TaxID=3252900 RepID=UPI003C2EAC01
MKRVFLELVKIIRNNENGWIPASLAYSFIVSFIPIVFAFAIIAIKYFVNAQGVVKILNNTNSSIPYVNEIIENVQNNFSTTSIFLTFFLVGYSIYMASGSIRSIITATNNFFEFNKKSGIYNLIASILVVLFLLISMLIAMIVIGFLPEVLRFLRLDILISYSYIAIIPIMFIVLYIIFKLTSGLRLPHQAIWPGALLSSLSIFILVTFSSLILNKQGVASQIFGPFITILLFAHFLYFISYCIYFGLALNVASFRVEKYIKRQKVINHNTIYGK